MKSDKSDEEHCEISSTKPACYYLSATWLHLPNPVLVLPCFHIEKHTAATPGQNTTCTWKMINKSQMWNIRNVISPSLDPQSPLESR